jgi:hypothetical protein
MVAVWILKSTPIVEMNLSSKVPLQNRARRQDLPTPESPTRMISVVRREDAHEGLAGVRGKRNKV